MQDLEVWIVLILKTNRSPCHGRVNCAHGGRVPGPAGVNGHVGAQLTDYKKHQPKTGLPMLQ